MASSHFLISYCCSPEQISTFPWGTVPLEEVVSCDEGTPQPSLLKAEETKWPQPLVWLSLETFHHLVCPSLDTLWYQSILLALSCLKVHTGLEAWSRFLWGKYSTKFVQTNLLSPRMCEYSQCSRKMGVPSGSRSCCFHGWYVWVLFVSSNCNLFCWHLVMYSTDAL